MNERRPLTDSESALLETFIAAAQSAAADWVGAELFAVDQYFEQVDRWNEALLIASIPLQPAPPQGPSTAPSLLMMAMDAITAAGFAERAFAESNVQPDQDLVRDFVAEFANLTAGRAKALTLGSSAHFLLGTPTLNPPATDRPYLTANIRSEFGDISLLLELPQSQ